MPVAGWYEIPTGEEVRWWDGTAWTEHTRSREQLPKPSRPFTRGDLNAASSRGEHISVPEYPAKGEQVRHRVIGRIMSGARGDYWTKMIDAGWSQVESKRGRLIVGPDWWWHYTWEYDPGVAKKQNRQATWIAGIVGVVIVAFIALCVVWMAGVGWTYETYSNGVECRERTIIFHQEQCRDPDVNNGMWQDA